MTLCCLQSSSDITLFLDQNCNNAFNTVPEMFSKGTMLLRQLCLPYYFKSTGIPENSSFS